MCAECLAVIRASANFSLIRGIMRHGILLACSHSPRPSGDLQLGLFSPSQYPGGKDAHAEPEGSSPTTQDRGRHGGFALWLVQNEAVPSFPSSCSSGLFRSTLSHTGLLVGSSFSSPSQSLGHLPRLSELIWCGHPPGKRCWEGSGSTRSRGSAGNQERGFVWQGVAHAWGDPW